jgi:hypothetical protein
MMTMMVMIVEKCGMVQMSVVLLRSGSRDAPENPNPNTMKNLQKRDAMTRYRPKAKSASVSNQRSTNPTSYDVLPISGPRNSQ